MNTPSSRGTGFQPVLFSSISKKILLILLSLTPLTLAQQPPTPSPDTDTAAPSSTPLPILLDPHKYETVLGSLLHSQQRLIIRGFTDIGALQNDDQSGIAITAVEAFTPDTTDHAFGLAITIRHSDRNIRPTITYIDAIEFDFLFSGLDSLAKLDSTITPMTGYDARFRTKGGLEFSTFGDGNGARVLTIKGLQVHPDTAQITYSSAAFPFSRLGEIRQLLTTAKQTLEKSQRPK